MRGLAALVFAAFLTLGAAAPAMAQTAPTYTPAQLALAREVVALSGAEEMMRAQLRALAPQMAEQIVAAGRPRAFAERYVAVFLEEFDADAPRVLELGAVAYADAFTEQELLDLRTFYNSPTGRAFVQKGAAIGDAMTQVGLVIGAEVGARALQRMERERGPQTQNP